MSLVLRGLLEALKNPIVGLLGRIEDLSTRADCGR